jgi:hypothetical protein
MFFFALAAYLASIVAPGVGSGEWKRGSFQQQSSSGGKA